MKLSIVIPTINEKENLERLLSQIKNQSFKDYEIIVSDAGSNDGTLDVARLFRCKITKGGLPAKGRNEGAKIAKGELILFIDSDDIILSNDFLDKALNEFEKRNLGIATFPLFIQGNKFDKFIYFLYNKFVKTFQRIIPIASNIILVKRDIHFKIKGFDEEVRIAEDVDYTKRAAKVCAFGFIDINPPVLTSSRRIERDGRIRTYLKYLFVSFLLIFGPIKYDIIKYRFNHYKQ
jgi:glycosyltransferase involved in cell wall biosynthesis